MKLLVRAGAFLALVAGVLGVAAVIGSEIGIQVAPGDRADEERAAPVARPAPAPTPIAVPAPRLGSDLPEPAAGLSVSSRGLRVIVPEPEVETGEPTTVRFRLIGARVRHVDATVVRLDARYLQLPAVRHEGAEDWAVDLRIPRAGAYRLILDTDRGRRVLGADLFAPGPFEPMPIPAPAGIAAVDGLTVGVSRSGTTWSFAVSRRGRTIAARPDGPAVAVRAGDMAYATGRPV
ncbi:MAG TPA: hypothetical protein VF533_16165, partial [Solirubrobacteraceae bacterium]